MVRHKTLIICGSPPGIRCGVGDHVVKLSDNLIRRDCEVLFLTSFCKTVGNAAYVYPLIKKWNFFSIFSILSFIGRERPDIINLHTPASEYKATLNSINLLPLLSKVFFRQIPFITTLHDYAISNKLFKMFFLPLFLFSDAIIVTNREDKDEIVKTLPFCERKLKIIHMGPTIDITDIENDKKTKLYKEINYNGKDRIVSTFGLIKKDRHIDIVVKVFDKLSKKDDNLKLIIMGDIQHGYDQRCKRDIKNLIENLDLKGKKYFLGFRSPEEASFYLAISDLSILLYERGASFRRGSLINALVRGVPVVTNMNSRYGVDKELISSDMVLTVDSVNVDQIYEKAKIVLYDLERTDKMKEKMKEAKNMFNWQRNTEEVMAVYSNLLKK